VTEGPEFEKMWMASSDEEQSENKAVDKVNKPNDDVKALPVSSQDADQKISRGESTPPLPKSPAKFSVKQQPLAHDEHKPVDGEKVVVANNDNQVNKENSMSESPVFAQDDLIGRVVEKVFELQEDPSDSVVREVFMGYISLCYLDDAGQKSWRVRYEDGDAEDLSFDAIVPLLTFKRVKSSQIESQLGTDDFLPPPERILQPDPRKVQEIETREQNEDKGRSASSETQLPNSHPIDPPSHNVSGYQPFWQQ